MADLDLDLNLDLEFIVAHLVIYNFESSRDEAIEKIEQELKRLLRRLAQGPDSGLNEDVRAMIRQQIDKHLEHGAAAVQPQPGSGRSLFIPVRQRYSRRRGSQASSCSDITSIDSEGSSIHNYTKTIATNKLPTRIALTDPNSKAFPYYSSSFALSTDNLVPLDSQIDLAATVNLTLFTFTPNFQALRYCWISESFLDEMGATYDETRMRGRSETIEGWHLRSLGAQQLRIAPRDSPNYLCIDFLVTDLPLPNDVVINQEVRNHLLYTLRTQFQRR